MPRRSGDRDHRWQHLLQEGGAPPPPAVEVVLDDRGAPSPVERVVLCAGKIAHELMDERDALGDSIAKRSCNLRATDSGGVPSGP